MPITAPVTLAIVVSPAVPVAIVIAPAVTLIISPSVSVAPVTVAVAVAVVLALPVPVLALGDLFLLVHSGIKQLLNIKVSHGASWAEGSGARTVARDGAPLT